MSRRQAAICAIFERGTKRGLKVLKSLGGAVKIAATSTPRAVELGPAPRSIIVQGAGLALSRGDRYRGAFRFHRPEAPRFEWV
jgi:hypothetical protein